MSKYEIINVDSHNLVSVEHNDNITRLWDVYVASKGETYYGKATQRDDNGEGRIISWRVLEKEEINPIDELMETIITAY